MQQKFQGTKGHGRRRSNRKNEVDSDESESDTEHRTESSTQLEVKRKQSKLSSIFINFQEFQNKLFKNYDNVEGIMHHGTQSSTSSDISPLSEKKSLPRRNRSR